MGVQFQTTPKSAEAFVLPTGVLETVAARLRAGSVLLTVLRPDGSQAFADRAAGPFFQHYVNPLLERIAKLDPEFLNRARSAQIGSPAPVTEALPGLIVAALPHVERRQTQGILLVTAKH